MAEALKFGNLTIHFLGDNAAQLKGTFNRLYGSAAANTGSQAFRREISETARYLKNIYVGGSLQDLEQVPGYKDDPIKPAAEGAQKAAFGKALAADTYVMAVTGKEHTLVHGGRTFPGSTELAMAHEFLHPLQLIREWAQTGMLFRSDTGGPETQVQMREQRIAVELGMVVERDFPDVIGTETGYQVHMKPPESEPGLPTEIDPVRPQQGLPPGKQGAIQRAPRFSETQPVDQSRVAIPASVRPVAEGNRVIEDRAPADRITEIRGLMGGRTSDYWTGPRADALQQEYRDLIERQDETHADRQSSEIAPTLAGFGAGAATSSDTARLAELQSLMADRHSEYWNGPHAEVLQAEYRDLLERQDRDKLTDDELWPATMFRAGA